MMNKLLSLRITLVHAGFALIIAKGLTMTLTPWDCLGVLIIALAYEAERVSSYLFPKRADVHEEIKALKEELERVSKLSDETQRDVTALKFAGSVRAR